MKDTAMNESNMKDDPLTRIQREIIEVTERENEFRKGHPTLGRNMSESSIEIEHKSNGHVNGSAGNSPPKAVLNRAVSTGHLLASSTSPNSNGNISNGFSKRYTPNTGQKGIMQRFIASKGKLSLSPMNNSITPVSQPIYNITPPVSMQPVVFKLSEGKPIRKGFVPVEEKIQKELKDLKDRESELRKQRKKVNSYQLDFSSLDLSDKEIESESDEEDIPPPGKLRIAKSIGELYEALGDGRSPSPIQASGPESYGSLKPAKSLAQLCDLGPDEEALAPSSTKLIAKWESLIQKKQESGAA